MRLTFSYLKRQKVFDFLGGAKLIINRMEASPLTPHPNPSIPAMQAAYSAASDMAEKAKFGDRNFANLREEKFEILRNMIIQQGGYIVNVCKTDADAESLGFRVAKQRSRSENSVPQGLKALPTSVNNGVELSWRKSSCHNAYCFKVEMTQDNPIEGEATWKEIQVTNRSRVTIGKLNYLEKYWFRVVALYVSGPSPFSNPVMSVVL